MSNIYVNSGQRKIGRAPFTTPIPARATADGAPFVANWQYALVMEGSVFVANAGGTGTGPFTCTGLYDADGPDLYVYVPDTLSIAPLSLEVVIEGLTDNEDIEIIAIASRVGDSTATVTGGGTVTPVPVRTRAGTTSGCTVSYGVDAAGVTDPNAAGTYAFWRTNCEIGAAPAAAESEEGRELRFAWTAQTAGILPVIEGEGALAVYVGKNTAATVFITLMYAERPKGDL